MRTDRPDGSSNVDEPETDSTRPHMVMVVGNRVVGDSRVEKSALAAHRAGYQVTVLGLIHRTVPALGLIDDIPVLRVAPAYEMHQLWLAGRDEAQIESHEAAIQARRRLRRLHIRAGSSDRTRLLWRVLSTTRRRIEDARLAVTRIAQNLRWMTSHLMARMPVAGIWRYAWPQIADLELAYAEAIVDLQPDIIHVHDRHILPGASTAASILKNSGRVVKWIYDAHEWLPGVEFQGPKAHAVAWLAAESETIGRADAVITVSDELAEMLKERHKLRETPSVVTNAPPTTRTPVPDEKRVSVRDDCGLDSQTDLLVYVGSIAKVRGLETIVSALSSLPGVHLALVAPPDTKRRREIVYFAAELGVADRLHILDYVPAKSVTTYISSASIGMSPVEPIANYQYSLATKIREYLHAGIPIVGSNLQTLKRFLEESGVGAVHAPSDPEDCARVVKEVLENRQDYVDSITEELLIEHSWERQEAVLTGIWGALVGEPPSAQRPSTSRPRLVVGPAVDLDRSQKLLSAVCRYTKGAGEVIDRTNISPSGHLAMNISEYRRLVAQADGLILESLRPLFGGLMRTPEAQLTHVSSVRPVAFMLDTFAGVEFDELVGRVPDFWMMALDIRARERISVQARTTRRLLQAVEVPVLATSPFPMRELANVRWLPTVVDVEERESAHRPRPVQVLLAPGHRAGADALLGDEIMKLVSSQLVIHRPSSQEAAEQLLPESDVLVDNLGHGSYTDLATRAMGHGCVVISRLDPEVRSLLPLPCPTLDATPETVLDLVSDLQADPDRLDDLRAEAISYAREVHDGRMSAQVVAAAMGWARPDEP